MVRFKSLEVRGFTSLREVTLDFGALTVLIGENDAGKTNILRSLQLLANLNSGLQPALADLGGLPSCTWLGQYQEGFEIDLYGEIRDKGRPQGFRYSICLFQEAKDGPPLIRAEQLSFDDQDSFFRKSDGVFIGSGEYKAEELQHSALYYIDRNPGEFSSTLRVGHFINWVRQDEVRAVARAIRSLKIHNLSPRALAQPSAPTDNPALKSDGQGLATLLEMYASHPDYQDTFEEITDQLRRLIPHFHRIGTKTVRSIDGELLKEIQIRLRLGERLFSLSANQVSDGLILLLGVLVLSGSGTSPLIMLEEPENGVHISLLQEMVKLLRKASQQEDGPSLLITTHSPYFLDYLEPEEIVIVTRDQEGGTRLTPLQAFPDLKKWQRGFTLGEIWTNLGEEDLTKAG